MSRPLSNLSLLAVSFVAALGASKQGSRLLARALAEHFRKRAPFRP
jgi:hypothetical protein